MVSSPCGPCSQQKGQQIKVLAVASSLGVCPRQYRHLTTPFLPPQPSAQHPPGPPCRPPGLRHPQLPSSTPAAPWLWQPCDPSGSAPPSGWQQPPGPHGATPVASHRPPACPASEPPLTSFPQPGLPRSGLSQPSHSELTYTCGPGGGH